MLRQGRFRHQLFSPQELQERGAAFFKLWSELRRKVEGRDLPSAELAALYLWTFAYLRRPQDFLGGPNGLTPTQSGKIHVSDLQSWFPGCKQLLRFSQQTTLMEVITGHSLRSIPLACNRSLKHWHEDYFPLVLMHTIPSPIEVLELQCEGKRVVSLLQEEDHFDRPVENDRDMLGFLVHDLIHADHFFADQEQAQEQILFSRLLRKLFSHSPLRRALQEDLIFEKEFFYLASDMNSVSLHLFKTLKAIFLGYFKRTKGIPLSLSLSETQEIEFRELTREFMTPAEWNCSTWESFERLNTKKFEIDKHYLHLLDGL